MQKCPQKYIKWKFLVKNLDQFHRGKRLTANKECVSVCVRVFFFNMNWNIIWCFFSPEPPPCGLPWSPPARSKVIFDGMDNSFHRDRQDTVRACSSLKLPSNCQRHSLINHFKRRSKLVPWQSRDKQWYENSASRETYMLYHSLRFEIIHALL